MKKKRLSTILKMISERDIQTQTQLTEALLEEGYTVTQATVSRDINELGLIKIPSPDGGWKYANGIAGVADKREHIAIFSKSVTYPGMAQAVAASLDSITLEDVLGSIAGDDTILLITKSEADAMKVAGKLEDMFE